MLPLQNMIVNFLLYSKVKNTQLTGFPYTINALASVSTLCAKKRFQLYLQSLKVGAFCVASSGNVYEIQVVVPIIVGALLHCNVSEACPDPSITEYAKDQRIVLLLLVGLGTLALVLRIFDKVCTS